MADSSNKELQKSTKLFQQGKYADAAESFRQQFFSFSRRPELLIYQNNALARNRGKVIKIAVIISQENREGSQEILRGVADAQKRFNEFGHKYTFLEVVIVNEDSLNFDDSPEGTRSRENFTQKLRETGVVAVVGHRFSNNTRAMIDAYEKNNLVLISPTATLGSLSDLSFSDRFMRTAPSDISLTQELVKAIPPRAKILVVYDSQSPYSRQLKDQLHNQYITINGIINELDLSKDNLKFNQYGDTFAKMVNEKNITAIVLFPDKDTPPQAIDLAIANERQLGTKKLPLFGNTVLYENIHLIRGGSALEGMILSVPGSDSSCYISQAKKDWGGGISWRTQTSFDAAKTLIGLLKRVIDSNQEVTHKSLWDEAAKGITISGNENSCQTSGQTIRFLSNGDFAGEPRLVQVKGARFVPYLPK